MKNNILAKYNKITGDKAMLIEHSIKTAEVAKKLCENFSNIKVNNSPFFDKCAIIAALFHDIGKATELFQNHLLKGSETKINHSIVSAVIAMNRLHFKFDKGGNSKKVISRAILYHHPVSFTIADNEIGDNVSIDYALLKDDLLISENDNSNIIEIINELVEYYNTKISVDFNDKISVNADYETYPISKEYIASKNDDLFFAICNIVKFADIIASSGKSIEEYICRNNLNEEIVFNKPVHYDDRFEEQIKYAQMLFDDKRLSVFDCQTGFGKTLLGLKYLLSNNKKGYWICPRNTIAEGIYNTICKEIDALQLNGKVSVGLLLTNEWKAGNENADIIVTNIDNFVRPTFRTDSNNRCYNMLSCNCIFDEFHEYVDDEAIMAMFQVILSARYKYMFDSKTLLLSATTIDYFVKDYKGNADFYSVKYNYEPILNKKLDISFSDEVDASIDYKNKNYFISVNTITKAQDVYKQNIVDNIAHSRYMKKDIENRMNCLFNEHGKNKNIPTSWVATNIISTGIDVSFGNMIVSWPIPERLIQSLGRCNRWNECIEIPKCVLVKDDNDKAEQKGIDTFSKKNIAEKFYNFLKEKFSNKNIITLRELYEARTDFYEKENEMLIGFFEKTKKKSFENLACLSYEYTNKFGKNEDVQYISNKAGLRCGKSGKDKETIKYFAKVKNVDTKEFIEEPIQIDTNFITMDFIDNNINTIADCYKAIASRKNNPYFKNEYAYKNKRKNDSKFRQYIKDISNCSKTPILIPVGYFYDKQIGLYKEKSKSGDGYLDGLIEKVGNKFNGIDADEYINEMRGGNERYFTK